MRALYTILMVCVLAAFSSADKTFKRCDLARLLHNRYGFSRRELADWICLVKHESSFRTHVIGPENTDGSRDYGLFQINSNYWCESDEFEGKSNGCNVDCDELTTNDIRKAVRCARKIHSKSGFSAWMGWKQHCHLPDSVDHCFIEPEFHGGSTSSEKCSCTIL